MLLMGLQVVAGCGIPPPSDVWDPEVKYPFGFKGICTQFEGVPALCICEYLLLYLFVSYQKFGVYSFH